MNTRQIMKSIPFTKEGFENLKKEQVRLEVKRKETVVSLSRAREMGDLSENALYKAAKMELGNIDRQLRRLAHLIRFAKIVEATEDHTVQIGKTILVDDGKRTREFHIVGGYESNPLEGKISHHSPIGKMLIGKKTGDIVDIQTPGGIVKYTVKDIN